MMIVALDAENLSNESIYHVNDNKTAGSWDFRCSMVEIERDHGHRPRAVISNLGSHVLLVVSTHLKILVKMGIFPK